MKLRPILFLLVAMIPFMGHTQNFSGEYITEWQWNMKKETNWVNLLRLDLTLPLWKNGSVEAATIHVAKTNESIIDDWQTFSNIEEENNFAAIAVLGYMHSQDNFHLFGGVRNVNENFFTSDITSLFTGSSCGIFPTVSASYPIANYPLSGLTVYFDVKFGGWTFKNSIYNGAGYNGWKHNDNPFIINPKKDGVFDMAQLEYEHQNGHYFAGVAFHSRHHPIDEDGEMLPVEESSGKASCAWWVYGEQPVWTADGKDISIMAQYSENTCRQNGCYRYGELGCVYSGGSNRIGLSGQYARFHQGTECSVEVTWHKSINESLAIQPAFQYVNNANGNYTVLCTRLYYSF